MLISSLIPLLSRYSLGFDLIAGRSDPSEGPFEVTLTIIPRKAEGATRGLEAGEIRPICITATAAEIDAELALGADGALGQLIAARKTLGDQLTEQQEAAEAAKKAAADAAKAKAKPAAAAPAKAAAPVTPPAAARPGEPASLW